MSHPPFRSFVVLELCLLVNRHGQTLGKGLMRIRVIRVDERPLTVGASFIRLVVLFAVTVDRRRRRAAHDWAARTQVVMADRRSIKLADLKLMAPKISVSKRPR